jgi:carbon storage regulator
MLILSRRPGQGLRIGDAIRVTVISVDGQFVRLGIEAPAASKILREELWRAVAEDNQESSSAEMVARAFAQAQRATSSSDPG